MKFVAAALGDQADVPRHRVGELRRGDPLADVDLRDRFQTDRANQVEVSESGQGVLLRAARSLCPIDGQRGRPRRQPVHDHPCSAASPAHLQPRPDVDQIGPVAPRQREFPYLQRRLGDDLLRTDILQRRHFRRHCDPLRQLSHRQGGGQPDPLSRREVDPFLSLLSEPGRPNRQTVAPHRQEGQSELPSSIGRPRKCCAGRRIGRLDRRPDNRGSTRVLHTPVQGRRRYLRMDRPCQYQQGDRQTRP